MICSFCPRKLDFDPLAVPIPYHHSNLQCEEMIYYVSGNFGSRKGVDVGSITLHPSGLPHGPQPGLAEKSIGLHETGELAVMCDTFNPLKLSKLARDLDDGKYALSWYEAPDEEASEAGLTSHLYLKLVLDWDGTVTVQDSLVLVIHEFGDPAARGARAACRCRPDAARGDRARVRLGHAPLDEVVALGRRARRRSAGFRELAEALEPVVLSAGFRELIEPVLEREGVRARGAREPAGRTAGRLARPFRDEAACTTCGEPCKRGASPASRRLRRRRLLGPLRSSLGRARLRARLPRAPPRPRGLALRALRRPPRRRPRADVEPDRY